MNEVRIIQGFEDIENFQPLKDQDTIRVYHGFYSMNDALLFAKYGMSGKVNAKRNYSYEAGNNPKGLFVTIDFKQASKDFAGSGVIMEFDTRVSNLEAPAWVGGRDYFVQGEYTKDFGSEEERQKQQLLNRQKHSQSEYPAIANSDRPELARSLFNAAEHQALFIGDLNPNMIRAFWVHEGRIERQTTKGEWQRVSRLDFLKRYYNEERFKTFRNFKGEYTYGDNYYDAKNKIFKPNDDFDLEKFKAILGAKEYDFNDFIEYYVKNWDQHAMNTYFYPKQQKQIKQLFGIEDKDLPDINKVNPNPNQTPEYRKYANQMIRDYFKAKNKLNPDFQIFLSSVFNSKPEYREYYNSLSDYYKQKLNDRIYNIWNKLRNIKSRRKDINEINSIIREELKNLPMIKRNIAEKKDYSNLLHIKPNHSRQSGINTDLIYLSIERGYAEAYANGRTTDAHVVRMPVRNGVIFSICLNEENTEHFGGDVWTQGFRDDIVTDIQDYMMGEDIKENVTKEFLERAGVDLEQLTNEGIQNFILQPLLVNNISIISPLEWSEMQNQEQGYSEICLKEVRYDQITKVEIYKDSVLIKTIKGGNTGSNCQDGITYYHGSPLEYWKHLL